MIKLPIEVQIIIEKFNYYGYEAFIVGGCVRDSLMGREPMDWDITTDALPEEIILICANEGYKIYETGLKHGTVTVMPNDIPYEITTYRVDGQYSDNRRPDSVSFTTSLEEDLSRRDFTINAIAYSPEDGFRDPFNGRRDIERKVITCVGDPWDRFEEDGLRILRAIRFASVLGFNIADTTWNAIHDKKALLQNISAERINSEFCKIICGQNAVEMLLQFASIFFEIIPELKPLRDCAQNNPYHYTNVWHHTVAAFGSIEPDLKLRLVMLFHDLGKPHKKITGPDGIDHFYQHSIRSAELAEEIMYRLKFDNITREFITEMVLHHDMTLNSDIKSVKKYLNKFGYDKLEALLKIKEADKAAHTEIAKVGFAEKIQKIRSAIQEIKNTEACFKLKDLNINGNDIINLGLPPGKLIGLILGYLLQQVMEDNIPNKKEALIQKAQEYIDEIKNLSTV